MENTTLKQGARQLTAGNRSLAGRLKPHDPATRSRPVHHPSRIAARRAALTAGRASSELSSLKIFTPGQRQD